MTSALPHLPNVDLAPFRVPDLAVFGHVGSFEHAPRILLLYGSLRERSYNKLTVFEAERLLQAMGAETRVFDPSGLPLADAAPESHPKFQELRAAAQWAEGMSGARLKGTVRGGHHENTDRLDSAEHGCAEANAREDVGGDAGLRWLAILQRGQSDAGAGPMDAHADDSETQFGGQCLPGVRCSRPDETTVLLRPHR